MEPMLSGATLQSPVTAHMRQDFPRLALGVTVGEATNGVYVGSRTAGGPAANAGIQVGDLVLSVDRKATPTTASLSAVLAVLRPGQTVPVVVTKQNGMKTTVRVTLGTYPGSR